MVFGSARSHVSSTRSSGQHEEISVVSASFDRWSGRCGHVLSIVAQNEVSNSENAGRQQLLLASL